MNNVFNKDIQAESLEKGRTYIGAMSKKPLLLRSLAYRNLILLIAT